NGDTGLIGSVEKVVDQGEGRVDVLGDMVIVLDPNLQVKWYWNEFDHLDIRRQAIFRDVCAAGIGGLPPLYNPGYTIANDWTHSNSLALTPDDNFVISLRHQDWIIKFSYQNGQGDGSLLWVLGKDGDFNVDSTNPDPWFSHQHDAEFQPNGLLSLL